MPTITDTFPPPSLDTEKWTEDLVGTTSLVIGTPTDGLYPQTVDDSGDVAGVQSESKIYVAANHNFDMDVAYLDVYSNPAPPVTRDIYFGWRSMLKGGGVPVWGVVVLLRITTGPVYTFYKIVRENGTSTETSLGADPTVGSDGGFRIVRSGTDYLIYYDNAGWVLLDTVSLSYTGVGFVQMGVSGTGVTPPAEEVAWIYQP